MGEHGRTIFIVAALVLVLGVAAGWLLIGPRDHAAAAPLTEVADPAVIQKNSQLSHLSIATSENFARQKIYVISAYLKNAADKPMRMAEVKMTFTDYDGKPVLEYSQKVLDRNQKALPPGTEVRFEIREENLPRTWNYRIPNTEITKIGF